MDTLAVAHRTVGVVRALAGLDGAKNTLLHTVRGAGQGTLRSEPPVIRMAIGAVQGGFRAQAEHQASFGVRLLDGLHDALGQARAAR